MNRFSFKESCYYDENNNKFDGRFLLDSKLLDQDNFTIGQNNEITIKNSFYRNKKIITGVLILNNITYGKFKNKFLYKCIPTCKNLPNFLIPFEKKYSFEKNPKKLYIIFKYHSWNDSLPTGTLLETFGDIDNFPAYSKYLLYSKELFSSSKNQVKYLQNTIFNEFENVEDRTKTHQVFTIDPKKTTDFDDAFSVCDDKITIYIANSPLVLDKLNMWNFINQVSTIYLPHETRHMLSKQLSQNWCSLVADNKKKITFYMEYDTKTLQIKFGICNVKIWKNYIYQEKNLFKNVDYQFLSKISNETDSHNVVSYYMMFMNKQCAKILDNGIFRSTQKLDKNFNIAILNDIFSFCGVYNTKKEKHVNLDIDEYGHFTSPIRRLVDTINLIQIQTQLNLWTFTEQSHNFCNKWIYNIDKINEDTKNIKKIQTNCHLVKTIQNDTLTKCIIVEKYKENKYTVYSLDFRFFLNLKSTHTFLIGDEITCKIFRLKNEDDIKKKIRLSIIT